MKSRHPLRIAVVNDDETIVESLARMFEPFASRVSVVEVSADCAGHTATEVEPYDALEPPRVDVPRRECDARQFVLCIWNLQADALEAAIGRGAGAAGSADDPTSEAEGWPGQGYGLNQRESEIIVHITRGLSNQDIADAAYLSINSVKSYINSSYRKMGVTSRTQAVLWGIDHGLRPERIHLVGRLSGDPQDSHLADVRTSPRSSW